MVAYAPMDFKQYKHVIFDFDETLATLIVDWKFWHTDIVPIIKKYEPDFDEALAASLDMSSVHQFIDKYGQSFRRDYVDFEISIEQKHYHGYKIIDQSLALLKKFHQQNKTIYLLTSNSREIVLPILQEMRIADYFARIITVNDVENVKPSPAPFKLIKDEKIALDQYLMVGDSVNDSGFAKNVGIAYLDVKDL
jgi:HAD superfamily hydrolase (TIGR01549 family)